MLSVKKVKLATREEDCGQINIIIGPNNSGKSTFLRELSSIVSLSLKPGFLWLKGVTVEISGLRTALQDMMPRLYTASSFEDIREYQRVEAHFFSHQTANGSGYHGEDFYQRALAATDNPEEIEISADHTLFNRTPVTIRFALMKSVAVEMCEQRIQVSTGYYDTQVDNINNGPKDIVGFFWRNPEAFSRVQASMKQAFGIKIGFDNLIQAQHPVRILPKQRITGDNKLPTTAQEWERNSPLLVCQGDGIKAYYKILLSIEDKTNEVILVDEPESFLHPPQRRDLGRTVVKLASEDRKQLFIATHDSEFLRGVLDSNADLKIFYINTRNGNQDINLITSDDIHNLTAQTGTTLKSNLLNERVLNSFFYKKTVVCESENDRSFYEHAAALYHWHEFQDVNFIGFTGKEFARPLFEKLKSLHINAALVVDIDFLLDGKLPTCADQATRNKLNIFRNKIKIFLEQNTNTVQQTEQNRRKFKRIGYKMLANDVSLAEEFWGVINSLKVMGVHVVHVGEMESFTASSKNDLDNALSVIRATRKRDLSSFLKEVLSF